MATVQIRVDDTADVIQYKINHSLLEAIDDSRYRRNLYGPFDNAEDAVASMLED